MSGRIDEAMPTNSPLTAISRRADQPKFMGSPVSRTTRMPINLLPPGLAVVRPLARHQDRGVGEHHDQIGEHEEDARNDRARVASRSDPHHDERQDDNGYEQDQPIDQDRGRAAAPARQRLPTPPVVLRDRLLPAAGGDRTAVGRRPFGAGRRRRSYGRLWPSGGRRRFGAARAVRRLIR